MTFDELIDYLHALKISDPNAGSYRCYTNNAIAHVDCWLVSTNISIADTDNNTKIVKIEGWFGA